MSDNNHENNRPGQDTGSAQEMENFFQEQFDQWDREEEEASRPPEEEVDANGFRVLTLNVGRRKQKRHVLRPLIEQDEEENALEAMLEANSNKSEKVTFLPFVPRPVEERENPPAPQEEKDVAEEGRRLAPKDAKAPEPVAETPPEDTNAPESPPEPPAREPRAPKSATETPVKDTRVPEPAAKTPVKDTRVPEPAAKTPVKDTRVPEPAAKTPVKDTRVPEPAAKTPVKDTRVPEPAAETPAKDSKVTEPEPQAPGSAPDTPHETAPREVPVREAAPHTPKRLRPIKPEPVLVRFEQEDEEEIPVSELLPPREEPERPPAREQQPVQAAQEQAPKQASEKAPEPSDSQSPLDEAEEALLERELEARAQRIGIMDQLFGSWFEERLEGQQRQVDADAEYELEHAEEHKGITQSLRLPRLPLRKRKPKWVKDKAAPAVEGEVVEDLSGAAKGQPDPKTPGGESGKGAATQPAGAVAQSQSEQADPSVKPLPKKGDGATKPLPKKGDGATKPLPKKGDGATKPLPKKGDGATKPLPKKGDGATKPLPKKADGATKPLPARAGKGPRPVSRGGDNVISMTEASHPSGLISKKLSAIREQADEFADTMFVSDSAQGKQEEAEQARVARLIPATDEEQEASPRNLAREERRRKREERQRHAPDTSPKELFRTYSSSYKSRRGRLNAQFFTAAALLAVTALAGGELTFVNIPALQENLRLTALLLTGGLALACGIGLDTLLEGIVCLLRGRPSLSTLSSLGALLTLLDGVWYSAFGRQGPLPFCGFAALSLWAMAFGQCRKTQGLRDACEDAYTRSEYERVTMDEGMWSGKGVYRKEPGGPQHFGSQIQEPDGAEQVYRYAAPVMMALCAVFGVLAVIAQRAPQMLIWNWSVIFIMATPLSATLAYGMPYARQVRRLRSSGVVLAGWDGAESLRGDAGIVLTDRDLFPEGTVRMKGIQNFGDISLEKVTGCTASLVRQADLGIAKLFDDQLRIQGGFYRRVDQMETSEESGCTGILRGDTVMIGTAGYLQVHGIDIEPGYQVKNAVFCGINGTLRGIFALHYEMPRSVRPAIQTLLQGGISPILATRDFNITPEVLHTRFKLPSDRLQYPPVGRRYDLSAKKDGHQNKILGALLFREGINPFTDAILGGRRLCAVVRLNTMLTLLASALGAMLGLYLTAMNAFHSLSLLNTLFFLLMWLVPTVMVSRGVDQF